MIDLRNVISAVAKNGKHYVEVPAGTIRVGEEVAIIPPAERNLTTRIVGKIEGLGKEYKDRDGVMQVRGYFTWVAP